MNAAYLHVVINHLPIMGVPIAIGLLVLGLWTRDHAIRLAALLSFVVLGVLTVPVYLAGHEGEDFVERAPGVFEVAIDAHEDAATVAFAATELLAVIALFVFLRYGGLALLRRGPPAGTVPTPALLMVLAAATVSAALLGYAGRLGGRISHTEFASGASAVEADEREDDDRRGRGRHRRGRD
jgi:hypothetical protein